MSTMEGGPGGPMGFNGVDGLSIFSSISATLGRRTSELVLRFCTIAARREIRTVYKWQPTGIRKFPH